MEIYLQKNYYNYVHTYVAKYMYNVVIAFSSIRIAIYKLIGECHWLVLLYVL